MEDRYISVERGEQGGLPPGPLPVPVWPGNAIAEAFSGQLLGNRTEAIISLPRFYLSLPCQLSFLPSFFADPSGRARIHGVTLLSARQHVRFTRLMTLN